MRRSHVPVYDYEHHGDEGGIETHHKEHHLYVTERLPVHPIPFNPGRYHGYLGEWEKVLKLPLEAAGSVKIPPIFYICSSSIFAVFLLENPSLIKES